MNQLTEVQAKHVKVITAAFGPHANLRQLKDVNGGADVLHFQVEEKESFKFVGKDLLHSKCPKNIRQSFQKHACICLLRVGTIKHHMQLFIHAQSKHT